VLLGVVRVVRVGVEVCKRKKKKFLGCVCMHCGFIGEYKMWNLDMCMVFLIFENVSIRAITGSLITGGFEFVQGKK